MSKPLPAYNMMDEKIRLEAVSRFTRLNPELVADLNEIVDMAAQICNTPVALVTLLDENVQWFKAAKGVDMEGTGRELAFCNHTIKQSGLLMVPDMTADERFSSNPLVAAAPNVRFYAGSTLTTNDGHNIGSLCVIDMEQRELDPTQQQALKTLSKQVMRLMELNWSMQMLEIRNLETEKQKMLIEESEIKLQAIFNSTKDTHVLINKNMEVIAFNNAAYDFCITEHGKQLQTGVSFVEFISPDIIDSVLAHLNKAFTGYTVEIEWNLCPGMQHERWKDVTFVPIKAANGEVIGVAINTTDVTERKLQEDQINIQNAALTRIAIIQSHELRRPVASLLGIMALIKLEQTKRDDEYLEMLEYTVKELDQKICEIVKDSENTIYNHMAIVA